MNTDLSHMYLNLRLSRLLTIAAFLLTISVLGLKAQVAPSKKIAKILKSIYDKPTPNKFTLDAYEYEGFGKKIILFGTSHIIRNPTDSMFTNMEVEFNKLSPEIVFTEAITSYLHPSKEQNIQMGGDSAFPRFLAHKSGADAHIWDLDWGEMYNLLRSDFSKEDLYLFFVITKLQGSAASETDLIDALVMNKNRELSFMGLPVSEQEWNPEYFKSLVKSRLHLSYNSSFTQQNWDFIFKQLGLGTMAKIRSKLFQLRDLRLLTTIGYYAKTNDRMFIQVGAMHREVMKQVLPLYMESIAKYGFRKPIMQIKSLSEDSVDKPYHRKLKFKDKEVVLWADGTHDTSQIQAMSQTILEFKPSAILIEDFPEHYASLKNNINYAGEVGVIRYLGANNDLPVYNWASQTNHSLNVLSKKYKREDVCSALTFHYVMKYEQVFKNFINYDEFWNAISARLLCSNTLLSYYETSIGRFYTNATDYGFLSGTNAIVKIDFDKLRMVLRQAPLGAINKELELLKANELLNSILKQLQTNDRIFVHAPFKLIKSIEESIPALYKDYNSVSK